MARVFAEQARRIVGGGFAARLQAEKDAGYPTRATIEAILKGDDPLSQAEARVWVALGGADGANRRACARAKDLNL
jgi:hypothetical protein